MKGRLLKLRERDAVDARGTALAISTQWQDGSDPGDLYRRFWEELVAHCAKHYKSPTTAANQAHFFAGVVATHLHGEGFPVPAPAARAEWLREAYGPAAPPIIEKLPPDKG